MNGGFHPVKQTLSFFLAVTMMGFFFSACGKPARNTPYTFRVATDGSGERQWSVKLSERDVVSYTVTAKNDETDVVFTGLAKGSVNATVYLARAGETAADADDVYVLALNVDARKNVTQPLPRYGAYSVRLDGDVSGSEWYVECSDERIVHYSEEREYPEKSADEDGMQDFTQIYTFTGRRPGAVHVRICVRYPWAEGMDTTRADFWLLVDSEYRVTKLEGTDFASFRLSEQGSTAQRDVYEAVRTDEGVRLSHYYALSAWSEEKNDYVEERMDETVIDGGEALYIYLAGLVHACGVPDWNGFSGSDPRVLDGTMFSFEATLADSGTVTASGSNAYPQQYREFRSGLYDAMKLYAQPNEMN